MSREWRFFLDDMIAACARIIASAGSRSRAEFEADADKFDAVVWNITVIGEAARHVPAAVRSAAPAIKWSRIVGMRNVIAHGYFQIDRGLVWAVVTREVPGLLEALRELKRRADSGDFAGNADGELP